ncbi:DUF4363 family protein [Virgibacillus sp. MSP4-1]|uniref:DUF4363 family protein n=1 Tax=Virgibacillus sp. MSP4-1 TaxID=2700081 RepID=UPI0003A97B85|nr:DUF4363 family protein [Virgibacillus sp. MSP4-1]QHS23649.1 DUF4363 family protein [Virgibacillus sp. MSP4-1]
MLKRLFQIMVIMSLITGCSATKETKETFHDQLSQLELSVNTGDWKQAKEQVKKIKKQYDRDLWKMQLLGEDNVYDMIPTSINQLKAAVKTQNRDEIIKQMETIKSYLSAIFGNQNK